MVGAEVLPGKLPETTLTLVSELSEEIFAILSGSSEHFPLCCFKHWEEK